MANLSQYLRYPCCSKCWNLLVVHWLDTLVVHVGAAVEPAEINTLPDEPKEGDEPTPIAPKVFSVTEAVVPLTWNCNVPSVLPVLDSAVVVVVPAAMILI
jgi:hypothetical protein